MVLLLAARRAGPRVLAAGLAIAAIGYAGAGLLENFAAVTAFATLGAFGAGIMLPNMLTWTLATLAPEVRGRGTGIWTGSFFLAQFIAPLAIAAAAGLASVGALALGAGRGKAAPLAPGSRLGRINRARATLPAQQSPRPEPRAEPYGRCRGRSQTARPG